MSDVEVFATGLQMGESPRWHEGALWMCDWGAGEVLRFDPGTPGGGREVVARVEGMPFSLDWLADDRMVLTTPDGLVAGPVGPSGPAGPAGTGLTPYGASGVGFNELVVRGEDVYVDQPGSLPWEERLPGIVGIVSPDGSWREVAGDVWFPNGMALTDGGEVLLVAESHADRITAFDVDPDGSLSGRRVWAQLEPGAAPDGVCLDADGHLWYASVPQQHCRLVAEGGQVLASVEVGQPCFSCVLGDDDGRTLYVVANDFSPQGQVGNGRVLRARV